MDDLVAFLRFLEARLGEEGQALRAWPLVTMRVLAARYADHEDYRERWRP